MREHYCIACYLLLKKHRFVVFFHFILNHRIRQMIQNEDCPVLLIITKRIL